MRTEPTEKNKYRIVCPVKAMQTIAAGGDADGMNGYFGKIIQASESAAVKEENGPAKEQLKQAVVCMKTTVELMQKTNINEGPKGEVIPLEELTEEQKAAQAFTGDGRQPSNKKVRA